jgi:threonine dehydratase
MEPLKPIALSEIEAARDRLAGVAVRTPLVRLNLESAPAEIYLKLENLQPVGSFKIRGAGNALLLAGPERLRDGVYTASAGNMAQGVAWNARRLGVASSAIVPDGAPRAKLDAMERLGMRAIPVPFDRWWSVITDHYYPGMRGFFVHPVADPHVMAGNGTIGLEILDDLPEVDAVVVPYGGGGLSCGIASALRALRPQVKVFGAEVETAAPLAASLAAGSAQTIRHTASFVDGIGGKSVLPEMWPLATGLLAGSVVVSLRAVADAVRLLVERNRVVAEGAGAAGVAAALVGKAGTGKVVCVISGGNIDAAKLTEILRGEIPLPGSAS